MGPTVGRGHPGELPKTTKQELKEIRNTAVVQSIREGALRANPAFLEALLRANDLTVSEELYKFLRREGYGRTKRLTWMPGGGVCAW